MTGLPLDDGSCSSRAALSGVVISDFNSSDPVSPCVKICVVDPETSLCIGCGRSRDEIAGWIGYSPEQKQAVIAGLDERLKDLTRQKRRKGGRRRRAAG